jgi:cysteinyl-tRNA synthetase
MSKVFSIYNTLTRKKEAFKPIIPGHAGMYVCGPTVYGEAHLGHARPAITFDLLFRYLQHLNYKVRYVRNITDVGHLVNDADQGEDKIEKKARLENLEPMEVVQHYTISFHKNMEQLNTLPPSIEPRATGHIMEQIDVVQKILDNGFAYESGGSVYFDVEKYAKAHDYGKLSGRKLEDMLENTRELAGQSEKRSQADFALWKKADASVLMQWKSPWSQGVPGWHLECTAMSTKYLGETFDIHGGGSDLKFPHHEAEIAQSVGAHNHESVNYWMHNNLITINGQKMGKSLGNFITLNELFSGNHKLLTQAFSPMTVRFFILQAHYRSTLDFSNEALQAAEKGLDRLMKGYSLLEKLPHAEQSTVDVNNLIGEVWNSMNDDLNSPVALAHLFEAVKWINGINDGHQTITKDDCETLHQFMKTFIFDVLGLKEEATQESSNNKLDEVIELLLSVRQEAKAAKNYALADQIRDQLKALGIVVKDKKDGFEWEIAE